MLKNSIHVISVENEEISERIAQKTGLGLGLGIHWNKAKLGLGIYYCSITFTFLNLLLNIL